MPTPDALSVEVRYAGIDILADPGTYLTVFTTVSARGAHISGRRSRTTPPNWMAGASLANADPFMWANHARAREVEVIDDGDIARWTAEHDGYASLDPPALHRRSVLLDRASRSIDIIDQVDEGEATVSAWPSISDLTSGRDRRVLRGPGLAHRIHTRGGTAGTAARAAVEPAPRRDRSHPRLVLPWPWAAAFPLSRSWAVAAACLGCP